MVSHSLHSSLAVLAMLYLLAAGCEHSRPAADTQFGPPPNSVSVGAEPTQLEPTQAESEEQRVARELHECLASFLGALKSGQVNEYGMAFLNSMYASKLSNVGEMLQRVDRVIRRESYVRLGEELSFTDIYALCQRGVDRACGLIGGVLQKFPPDEQAVLYLALFRSAGLSESETLVAFGRWYFGDVGRYDILKAVYRGKGALALVKVWNDRGVEHFNVALGNDGTNWQIVAVERAQDD